MERLEEYAKMLPDYLKTYLETEAQHVPLNSLREAHEQLSRQYRESMGRAGLRLSSSGSRQVYRLSRLPAIYAVIERLAAELKQLWPAFSPQSLLDLGAGPGTVALALQPAFPDLKTLTLLEQDQEQVHWGQALFQRSGIPVLQQARWQIANLNTFSDWPTADIWTLSYLLNELEPAQRLHLLQQAIKVRPRLLLLVEPGTPAGYQHILEARTQALAAGWQLLGPCPHAVACPLQTGDWCHFAVRISRSQIQRHLKRGQESYEDEKYSWLAVTPEPELFSRHGRILRRPVYRKGVVNLTLCQPEGLWQTVSIGRSQAAYKAARKAGWGDTLPL